MIIYIEQILSINKLIFNIYNKKSNKYLIMDEYSTISKNNIGNTMSLGSLYNLRNDRYVGHTLFNKKLYDDLISFIDDNKTYVEMLYDESYKEKIKKLNIDGDLKLSVLAGLVKLQGHGKYLTNEKTSFNIVRGTLFYSVKTRKEEITFFHDEIKQYVSMNALKDNTATHVVIGIRWGAQISFTFEHMLTDQEDEKEIYGLLKAEISAIKFNIDTEANVSTIPQNKTKNVSFKVKFYGI